MNINTVISIWVYSVWSSAYCFLDPRKHSKSLHNKYRYDLQYTHSIGPADAFDNVL